MFADSEMASLLERAEAAAMKTMVSALVRKTSGAFTLDLGRGVATYARADSPLNKVIGVGLDGALDPARLAEVEHAYRARAEAVRVEISTLAQPAAFEQLAARGYRLLGFENVLGRSLTSELPTPSTDIAVGPARTVDDYRQTVIDGFTQPDATGVVLDQLTHRVVADAIDDSLADPGALYVASSQGRLAGAGSMRIHDEVAVFTGAATLPAYRRRGVQSALIARRLLDARDRGARLAIITTAPGTQSTANVMKHGFALLYARAVLALQVVPTT